MRSKTSFLLASLITATALAGQAQAGVTFYYDDAPGFTAATAGHPYLGTETFEENSFTVSSSHHLKAIDDSLQQGVANGPYPTGLTAPITVQSNTNGDTPATLSPQGTGGLVLWKAGYHTSSGVAPTSDVLLNNYYGDSLDIIFDPSDQVTGVGFNPVSEGDTDPNLHLHVYDSNNVLLGEKTGVTGGVGNDFLGIATTGSDRIGRINIYTTRTLFAGADNIQVYAVPEPASLALLGLGGMVMMLGRNVRQDGGHRGTREQTERQA